MGQSFFRAVYLTAIYIFSVTYAIGQENPNTGQPQLLTLEDAAAIMLSNNRTIKIAEEVTAAATAQKQQLNSTWYPIIGATGGYIHSSNDISAKADLGTLGKDVADAFPALEQLLPLLEQLLPQVEQLISSLGSITLTIPLLKQNLTTIDIAAIWPLVTGGKRIYASRIGTELETTARLLYTNACNTQMALMINAYYTLKLANQATEMQQENLQYLNKLQHNAMRLKEEGFINKAEYLVVQVAAQEAQQQLKTSQANEKIALQALNTILGTSTLAIPCTPYLLPQNTPETDYNNAVLSNNTQLKILNTQQKIIENKKKIAIAGYLPDIALIARHNLYSGNIPSNLLPRSMIGATFQWNIFNGLYREKEIQKSNIETRELQHATDQTRMELITAASALQSKMENAENGIKTMELTTTLAKELLREREKSFTEGMCTPTEVVEAKAALLKGETALSLAYWEYNTALANLLALCSNSEQFIKLHHEHKQ